MRNPTQLKYIITPTTAVNYSSPNRWSRVESQFTIVYSPVTTELSQSEEAQYSLHSPGERTPISGQYEVINSNGKGTGLEVTSTAGNPFPPTSESDQSYRLVDPTKHKNPKK